VSGAATPGGLVGLLQSEGFVDVVIERKEQSREIVAGFGLPGAEEYAISAYILARKPIR
jgi:hypothetical protein